MSLLLTKFENGLEFTYDMGGTCFVNERINEKEGVLIHMDWIKSVYIAQREDGVMVFDLCPSSVSEISRANELKRDINVEELFSAEVDWFEGAKLADVVNAQLVKHWL